MIRWLFIIAEQKNITNLRWFFTNSTLPHPVRINSVTAHAVLLSEVLLFATCVSHFLLMFRVESLKHQKVIESQHESMSQLVTLGCQGSCPAMFMLIHEITPHWPLSQESTTSVDHDLKICCWWDLIWISSRLVCVVKWFNGSQFMDQGNYHGWHTHNRFNNITPLNMFHANSALYKIVVSFFSPSLSLHVVGLNMLIRWYWLWSFATYRKCTKVYT